MLLKKIIDNKIFYLINNEHEFQNALLDEHHELYDVTKNYLITQDIDLKNISPYCKKPIKDFCGILDGSNNSILNIKLNMTHINESYIGLFAYMYNATVKNLTINSDLKIVGKSEIGCLVGYANQCTIENCNLIGSFDISTYGGYNIGLLAGKMKSCIINNINISVDNSVIRGHHNIGGFVGNIYESEITESFICGKLTLFGITASQELLNDTSFTNDIYMESDVMIPFYMARQIGGFIGRSSYSLINNCNNNATGNILGYTYVGGFVGLNKNSRYTLCCMELDGCIIKPVVEPSKQYYICDDHSFIGIFCGYNIDIVTDDRISIFCDCKINITTKIDDELVNMSNLLKFEKIADTSFKVTFKDCVYPATYYNILDFKNELVTNETILYDLFSYILTVKQLESLKIDNILINTENEILLKLYKDFRKTWKYLNESDKLLYINLNFNENMFNCVEFPDIVWDNFTDIQRYSALKLGFNMNIWDNQFIQKVNKFKSTFDFNSIYGVNNQTRQILRFSLNITNLIVTIPAYIKTVILIEIKEYIIENLNYEIELTEDNIKIF